MRYDLPVYRPPSEASSYILQTTIGCPHNKCRFCFMYKDKRFRIRPIEEIKEDIASAGEYYGDSVHSVFFADGNSIIMKTKQLVEILEYCRMMFPNLERVTTYGAARIILGTKTPPELKSLRESGLTRIHMGLESGDNEILKKIKKGATSEEMISASNMIKEAGLELSQYVLLGIGGRHDHERHARNTAMVLSAMDPDFIRLRTLILKENAPLYEDFKSGAFIPCSPKEVLEEMRILLENIEAHSHFMTDHVSNYANINGMLPGDRARMQKELAEIKSRVEDDREFAAWLEDPNRCGNL